MSQIETTIGANCNYMYFNTTQGLHLNTCHLDPCNKSKINFHTFEEPSTTECEHSSSDDIKVLIYTLQAVQEGIAAPIGPFV